MLKDVSTVHQSCFYSLLILTLSGNVTIKFALVRVYSDAWAWTSISYMTGKLIKVIFTFWKVFCRVSWRCASCYEPAFAVSSRYSSISLWGRCPALAETTYPGRWIGRGGPPAYPPLSPDLIPIKYFLWRNQKGNVNAVPSTAIEDFVAKLQTALAAVDSIY
jgi:hypothetical protein